MPLDVSSDTNLRLFIAITLPQQLRDALSRIQREVAAASGRIGKPIPEENLHITLNFLGARSLNEVDEVIEKLAKVVVSAFSLEFTKIEYISRGGMGDLIWVKSTICPALTTLKSHIDLCVGGQTRRDVAPFLAHITLFRIKHKKTSLLKKAVSHINFEPLIMDADSFSLMQSIITSKGASYVELKRFSVIH